MNEIANAGSTVHPFRRNRAILFSLLALVLVVLSFHGVLDNLAFSKLDELIKETSGLLLLSVGIDAIISVLKTVEIPIVGIQVGQMLAPVDAAVERLSFALMLATGSLFLQRLLLEIATGSIFQLGFLAIAVMTATSLLLAQSDRVRTALVTSLGISHLALARFQDLLTKTFIVATVVRFIVPTFMIASLLVSRTLLAPDIEEHSRELERHKQELSDVRAQISEARDEVIEAQTTRDETPTHVEVEDVVPDEQVDQPPSVSEQPVLSPVEELQTLRDLKVQLDEKLARLESKRERLSKEIKEKRSGWFPGNTEKALAEVNVQAEQTQSEIEHEELKLACLDRSTAGGECEPFLFEHRKQALGELKIELESKQKDLRERLRLLEKLHAEVSDEAEGKTGSNWSGKIGDVWRRLRGADATEEVEAVKPKVEDIEHEIAKASALEKQKASEAACVNLRINGEHCDSPHVNDRVQSALDSLMREQLKSGLRGLRADLVSLQAEQKRLTELTQLEAELGRIESQIKGTKKLIDRNESELECAERRVAGEDCNTILEDGRQWMSGPLTDLSDVLKRVSAALNRTLSGMSRGVWDRLKAVADGAIDAVERLTQLLVLTAIENIVLPILFLAIALKASVPIARGLMRISTTMNEDARAALSAMDKALPSPKG